MSSFMPVHLKAVLTRGAVALTLVIGPSTPLGATAENDYFSLKKIFPDSKCSPVIPNYEHMVAGFAGGEVTSYAIRGDGGKVVEVISTFVNKNRDQWAIVGAKTDTKVIFCLYASGVGKGSVDSRVIEGELVSLFIGVPGAPRLSRTATSVIRGPDSPLVVNLATLHATAIGNQGNPGEYRRHRVVAAP